MKPHAAMGYSVAIALIASAVYLIAFSKYSNLGLAIIWRFWVVTITQLLLLFCAVMVNIYLI